MSEHTPLKIVREKEPAIIIGDHLKITVSRLEDFGDPLPMASLIVRAVSAHDDLLTALKQIEEMARVRGKIIRMPDGMTLDNFCRRVLAKAGA